MVVSKLGIGILGKKKIVHIVISIRYKSTNYWKRLDFEHYEPSTLFFLTVPVSDT